MRMILKSSARLLLVIALLFLTASGCSVRKIAIKKLGDALAQSGTTFASDNDPELVRDALPFSLKLIESLLAESPQHRGLLLAASSGFTQYAYAFIKQEADETESQDFALASAMRARARGLFLRARDYGLRGLETAHRGFGEALNKDPLMAVKAAKAADVPLLYWTAASWGMAITLSKNEPALIADQPTVEALIDRALELNEAYDQGAIHSFLISYEPVRQGAEGIRWSARASISTAPWSFREAIRPVPWSLSPNRSPSQAGTNASFNRCSIGLWLWMLMPDPNTGWPTW